MAAKFHNTLAEVIVNISRRIGQPRVVLTGGCFQNRQLTERAVRRLREEGCRPYWHQRVPSNDGGIALGQVMAAVRAEACAEGSRPAGATLTRDSNAEEGEKQNVFRDSRKSY